MSVRKTRHLLLGVAIPVAVALFASGAWTQSEQEPPRERAQGLPHDVPSSVPETFAVPNVPMSSSGQATAPAAVGGEVTVSDLPSGPMPEGLQGVRVHMQGDVAPQNQIEEEGRFDVLLPGPGEEYFEPQIPSLGEESAAEGLEPSAPGGFVDQWDALSNTGWFPPDTVVATGPKHVVEAVNSGFAIYTKFGTQNQGYTTFDSFLNKPAGWQGFMFDPRIVFDATRQKFVMLVLGRDDNAVQSYFWLAISQTSDPNGAWWRFRFNSTDTTGTGPAWLDYAGVSVDTWGVYVTGNFFYFGGGFRGANVWSINPAIMTGGATNGWRFWDVRWPSNAQARSLQPAHPNTIQAGQQTFFVNTFTGSGNQVCLWRMTGDRTNAPSLTRVAIGTAGYEAIGGNVDQPGSATDIDGGGSQVMNAIYSQSHVYFTLTDDVDNNGSRAGWLTVKLNVNTNTNVWQHLLTGPTGYYYFYPALAVLGSASDANIGVFGSWTQTADGAGQFASALFKIYDNVPAGTTGPFSNYRSGAAAYVRVFDGRNRWGDYSGAAYDYSCGNVWGAAEAAASSTTWRTTITGRLFGNEALCPGLEITTPNGGQILTAGTNYSIQWQRRGLPAGQQVRLFYNTGGSDVLIATLANTASSFTWNVPAVRSSTVTVRVRAWSGSVYGTDDSSDANFQIRASDLRTISPSVNDNLLLPGQVFNVFASVRNFGDATSPATTLRYYRSTNSTISTSDTQIGTDAVSALAANATSPESVTTTAPAALGNYWVGACVDAVAGETPTNNQCSTGVPITVARPDLVMSALTAPTSVFPGQTGVIVANTVQNAGSIETGGASTVALYYSADTVCTAGAPDVLLANRAAPALNGGASSSASTAVTIPANAAGGARYICAFADAGSVIPETNEGNNTRLTRIDVVPPSVNLKVNGADPAYPAFVNTTGRVRLTMDMTAGASVVDHYFLLVYAGTTYYINSAGNFTTTPSPIATTPPFNAVDAVLLDADLSSAPGPWIFGWVMASGGTIVNYDLVVANVTP